MGVESWTVADLIVGPVFPTKAFEESSNKKFNYFNILSNSIARPADMALWLQCIIVTGNRLTITFGLAASSRRL
jgi:hypothetical protein